MEEMFGQLVANFIVVMAVSQQVIVEVQRYMENMQAQFEFQWLRKLPLNQPAWELCQGQLSPLLSAVALLLVSLVQELNIGSSECYDSNLAICNAFLCNCAIFSLQPLTFPAKVAYTITSWVRRTCEEQLNG